MSDDMSMFFPDDLPEDWVPVRMENLNSTEVTFSSEIEVVAREFATEPAALNFATSLTRKFDYSPARNAVRFDDGEVVLLPQPNGERVQVTPRECDLLSRGHLPSIAGIRGASRVPAADWVPVEIIEVDGNRVTLSTPEETLDVYNHFVLDHDDAVAYHPRFSLLQGKKRPNGSHAIFWVSPTPIAPCTAPQKYPTLSCDQVQVMEGHTVASAS